MTPAGTSNELDVQNEWEENTHTNYMVVKQVPQGCQPWVYSIMSGRSPPLYCTLILIAMQSHQKLKNIRIIVPSNHTTITLIGACVNSKLPGRDLSLYLVLYNYIDRHARTPNKTKTKNTMSLNYNSLCCIASRNGWVSMKGIYKKYSIDVDVILEDCPKTHF